jgi:hypothetical protein
MMMLMLIMLLLLLLLLLCCFVYNFLLIECIYLYVRKFLPKYIKWISRDFFKVQLHMQILVI